MGTRRLVALFLLLAVLLGRTSSPAEAEGEITGAVPASGVGIVLWGGGPPSVVPSSAAAKGCTLQSFWVSNAGRLDGYVAGAPAFVNEAFVARFPGGVIPPQTPLVLVCTASAAPAPAPPATVRRLSGLQFGSQRWSGEILITGDVVVVGDLTIDAGAVVRFAASDDQALGNEVAADGFNDADPTRLVSYARTHSDLAVLGKLTARGTTGTPITFTSAADRPALADWQGVSFSGDGSVLDGVVVEWSRNGVTPRGAQPSSVLRNSTVRHTMWGCVSGGTSGMQVLDNTISDCGHEGVDVQDGNMVIRGNTISDSNAGIVVLAGSPIIEGNTIRNTGDGIGPSPLRGTPRIGANLITLAPPTSVQEWRYGSFAYVIFRGGVTR